MNFICDLFYRRVIQNLTEYFYLDKKRVLTVPKLLNTLRFRINFHSGVDTLRKSLSWDLNEKNVAQKGRFLLSARALFTGDLNISEQWRNTGMKTRELFILTKPEWTIIWRLASPCGAISTEWQQSPAHQIVSFLYILAVEEVSNLVYPWYSGLC